MFLRQPDSFSPHVWARLVDKCSKVDVQDERFTAYVHWLDKTSQSKRFEFGLRIKDDEFAKSDSLNMSKNI